MGKAGNRKKLSMLHALVTVAAATAILALSVTPGFSLGSGLPVGTGVSPRIIVYVALILLILSYPLIRQLYELGRKGNFFVLHALLTVAAAVIILILSVIPPLSFGSVPANSGFVLHAIAYGTLCVLICMWLRVDGVMRYPLLYAFIFSSVYGLVIECVQIGLPYRSFEMIDVMVNSCAAAVATIPCYAVLRFVPLYRKTTMATEVTSR